MDAGDAEVKDTESLASTCLELTSCVSSAMRCRLLQTLSFYDQIISVLIHATQGIEKPSLRGLLLSQRRDCLGAPKSAQGLDIIRS